MKRLIKLSIKEASGLIAQIARLLPIKRNRIVCIAHRCGSQYSDSPRRIAELLMERYGEKIEIIWIFNNPNDFKWLENYGIRIVKYRSFAEFYYSNTAAVFVTNLFNVKPYVIKRARKLIIDTTHGVAYKSLLTSSTKSGEVNKFETIVRRRGINRCNLCLSGNQITTEMVYRGELGYRGKILEQGLPRNDVFFADTTPAHDAVRKKIGLEPNMKIALVMPTWRKGQSSSNIDLNYRKLADTLESCLGGKWAILLRLHHLTTIDISELLAQHKGYLFDATNGFDAQELLCTADLLITDYSSVVWDFALRELPILLFQPDLKDYEQERGFNVPPSEWGLYSSESFEGLVSILENRTYNELCEASRKHLEKFGCCETGHATEAVCDIIDAFINGEEMA